MIIAEKYLSNLIRQILHEKIRDFKNSATSTIRHAPFNIDELKKAIDEGEQEFKDGHKRFYSVERTKALKCYSYCKQRLQPLGSGSSRAAFVLTSRFVIKVAIPYGKTLAGLAQNEHEVLVSKTSPRLQKIIPNVKSHDPDFYWIITELVKPLDPYSREYENHLGIGYNQLKVLIRLIESESGNGPKLKHYVDTLIDDMDANDSGRARGKKYDLDRIEHIVRQLNYKIPAKSIEFIKELILFAKQNDTPVIELTNQLATTADGRVVVYDYGFSEDVYQQHYSA